MSVTFHPDVHDRFFVVPNKDFNPAEPEDPIYNPRTSLEEIYLSVNLSNISAGMILRLIGYYNEELYGRIGGKDLDNFIDAVVVLQEKYDDNYITSTSARLERVARLSKHLNVPLVWA
jgi:hypothetical protein